MNARAFRRSAAILAHDLVMAAASFLLSLYMRLGDGIWWWPEQVVVTGLVAFSVCAAAVLLVVRLDTAVWPSTSVGDLAKIVRAALPSLAAFLVVRSTKRRVGNVCVWS